MLSDKLVLERLDERIAALERQAEQLQTKLQALRAARAEFDDQPAPHMTAPRPGPMASPRRVPMATVRPPRKGHTGALATAVQILHDAAGRALHITEIVRQLGERGIVVTKQLNLQSGLSKQVREKRLTRPRPGWFAAPVVRASEPRPGNMREENQLTLTGKEATAH